MRSEYPTLPPVNPPRTDDAAPSEPDGETDMLSTVAIEQVQPSGRAGRYSLKKFVARGGMGEVWLAQDTEIGRAVAVKTLRGNRPEMRERFLVEAQIAGQLEHPGIVPVHDFAVGDRGDPLYVMKFVHGRTLKKEIEEFHGNRSMSFAERRVAWTRLLETFIDVCHAIAYAHTRGVVHRDLKPDNIMLGAFGETLVLDWGLAKILSQETDLPQTTDDPAYGRISGVRSSTETQAGSVLGTVNYISPEAAEGLIDEIDESSDIFLLGATLFHLLTDEPPRKGSNPSEIVELARNSPIVSPRKLNPEVPKPLAAICLKAMARRKADRYPTALALADDVKLYLAGEPVTAYREPWRVRAARWARRHRQQIAAAAAASIVVAAIAFATVKYREARRGAEREASRHLADAARVQAEQFQQLAEEVRFYAAGSKEAAETAPYYDWKHGRSAVQQALAIADDWGPQLDDFPLDEGRRGDLTEDANARDETRRGELRQDLYELLLLDAQMELGSGEAGKEAAHAALERAKPLHPSTQGFVRLEAEAAGRTPGSESSSVPMSAWDHFLAGEQHRTGLKAPSNALGNPLQNQQNQASLNQAVAEYEAALQLDPEHYWSHFQLARCYFAMGQTKDAEQRLAACIARRPEAPWAYSTRGLVRATLGRFPQALLDLNRARELKPDFRPALLNRGVAFLLQNKTAQALEDFGAVLAGPKEKQLVEGAFYRGTLYMQLQKYNDALPDLERVALELPNLRGVFLDMAEIHLSQARNDLVLADLNSYLGIGNDVANDAPACLRRGALLRRLALTRPRIKPSPFNLARSELERAVELDANLAEAWNELGAVYNHLLGSDPTLEAKMLAAYAKVLELATGDDELKAVTLNLRGWFYVTAKKLRLDEGLADFTTTLSLDSQKVSWRSQASANCGVGYAHALKGNVTEADKYAKNTVNLLFLHRTEPDPTMRCNVACIYAQLAALEKDSHYQDLAIAQLQEAVRAGGTSVKPLLTDPALTPVMPLPEFKDLLLLPLAPTKP